MVPRRIGDVSCGENHTVWQTQRRHEEGSSHPCSLQQWSHQRLLSCFPFVLQRLRHSSSKIPDKFEYKFIYKLRIHSALVGGGASFWGLNIAMGDQTHIGGVNPECWVHNVGLFLWSMQSERRHCGGDSNLRLCCDFALMFPALAWGGKRLCSLREGGEGVRCGMGGESRQR